MLNENKKTMTDKFKTPASFEKAFYAELSAAKTREEKAAFGNKWVEILTKVAQQTGETLNKEIEAGCFKNIKKAKQFSLSAIKIKEELASLR